MATHDDESEQALQRIRHLLVDYNISDKHGILDSDLTELEKALRNYVNTIYKIVFPEMCEFCGMTAVVKATYYTEETEESKYLCEPHAQKEIHKFVGSATHTHIGFRRVTDE